jgi:hypothetical protein
MLHAGEFLSEINVAYINNEEMRNKTLKLTVLPQAEARGST